MASLLVVVGGAELVARALVRSGAVEVFAPMRTLLPPGTEDWRMAHITADAFREPDPVLWWQPGTAYPYNAQRMKGPVAEVPKPADRFRIVCYGDSNTDGPDRGGWPEQLRRVLETRHPELDVEVLNAGVAGYSSHQGLLRFREQVAALEPDLVLASFGWNDLARALGAPDASFAPPPAALVALQRLLLGSDAYRLLKKWLSRAKPPESMILDHRVPLEDYRENLRGFERVAEVHRAQLVLLTRPHRRDEAILRSVETGWRRRVPDYNDAVRSLEVEAGIDVVDVQAFFAERPEAFVDECHFTPEGHRSMAELLADRLAALGVLPVGPGRSDGDAAAQ